MNKKIRSALISVYNKDGLQNIVHLLNRLSVKIYSTGGTQKFMEELNVSCTSVESLTSYPSILGGRVKTLHPVVFGGILSRRDHEKDMQEMKEYGIPEIDLVIVDLYPFEDTVKKYSNPTPEQESEIIEKIDIGGVSLIRAAAKNFKDVLVLADKKEQEGLEKILVDQNAETTLEQRKEFAAKAFSLCANYDRAISNYFHDVKTSSSEPLQKTSLRYGENPHQKASFYGHLSHLFSKLNGKELSYNNLVDVDAALNLLSDLDSLSTKGHRFAIIKHTNVCGVAVRDTIEAAWEAALKGDPESAFGGILITDSKINDEVAEKINEIFFEVLIAPSFSETALEKLKTKKNRILLRSKKDEDMNSDQTRSLLNGFLIQENDKGNFAEWKEEGGRQSTEKEKRDLEFANLICKHLKSNAIAIVKNRQLIGKGCGQTSRIDAVKQAIEKAKQFNHDLTGSVLASDAFFPFDDCVKIGHAAGIAAFIQPGGSIRDKDSIEYCRQNDLVMVLTGVRHFKH